MTTASKILQILALSACFTAQVHGAFTMPGVRRALQTMAGSSGSPAPVVASLEFVADL